MDSVMWWERDRVRWVEEIESMQESTNAVLKILDGSVIGKMLSVNFDAGPHMVWEETITSNSSRKYLILIVCRAMHPYSAPGAWIIEPVIKGQHHMFPGDNYRLCLHDPYILPDMTYVLNIRNWACEWIECYETGIWPESFQR